MSMHGARRRMFRGGAVILMVVAGCARSSEPPGAGEAAEEPGLSFRSVEGDTPYVGDEACLGCHQGAAASYREHAMASSFHPWDPERRMEGGLDVPIVHEPTGFAYDIVEVGDTLYQEEFLIGPEDRRLHELRRRIDFVMGSGRIARTYFTVENGRLFQLPLTWYRDKGWDFSPGYELNNARFGRLLPDRCIACHGNYPSPIPFLEGKYAELSPGIGCERCHGPGGLHVTERAAEGAVDDYDDTIVNPGRLPFDRRLDVCEQCHVHTPVSVLRDGHDAFDYQPSEPLAEHIALFRITGSIDIVSHADRLRQSACFIATRPTEAPMECATCHAPHGPVPDRSGRNQPCRSCHPSSALDEQLGSSAARASHGAPADCVSCHMPAVAERTVPHGTFTDHWIRVVERDGVGAADRPGGDRPIEPYFERDRRGPDADVYRRMAEVVYATLATDAAALAAAAAALDDEIGADTTRADALFLLGLAFRQLGRHEDAIRVLEPVVQGGDPRPDRLHALARVYERAGRDADTIGALYERALQQQPALAWIRADYGDFLLGQGRRDEAEVAYRSALAERPGLPVAQFNLGVLLTERGRFGEATDAFERAVRLDPELAEAMSPLFQVMTDGTTVLGVRARGSLVARLPIRNRGNEAVSVTVGRGFSEPVIVFTNVAPGAPLVVLEPDGTAIRVLPGGGGGGVAWDLRDESGNPVRGGLYHVAVGSGLDPRQRRAFGIVRLRRS